MHTKRNWETEDSHEQRQRETRTMRQGQKEAHEGREDKNRKGQIHEHRNCRTEIDRDTMRET